MISKKFALIIFLIPFFSKFILAQDTSSVNLENRFALQFQISENFKLTSFQGTIFSIKYHPSESSAFRLGISMSGRNMDENYDDIKSDSLIIYNRINNQEFSISILPQYLLYNPMSNQISVFFGSGIYFNYTKNQQYNTKTSNFSDLHYTQTTENNMLLIGIDCFIGAEWFLHKGISISAESGLRFVYENYEAKNSVGGKLNGSGYKISPDYVKLGISVFF